jgi:hypothetical protein
MATKTERVIYNKLKSVTYLGGGEFLVLGQKFSVAKTKSVLVRRRRINLRNLWFNFFYLFSVVSACPEQSRRVPSMAKNKKIPTSNPSFKNLGSQNPHLKIHDS